MAYFFPLIKIATCVASLPKEILEASTNNHFF